MTVWVEGLVKSTAVKDIEAAIKYNNNVVDKAKMTFVWAELSPVEVEHDTKSAAALWSLKVWQDTTTPPKPLVNTAGGTGLRPRMISPTTGAVLVTNSILMKFKCYPADIQNEVSVKFDLARQIERKAWYKDGTGHWVEWIPSPTFPTTDDQANDDPNEDDESSEPNSNCAMFSLDAPGYAGPPDAFGDSTLLLYRLNAREYVRVKFDGTNPVGNGSSGTRCSEKYEWHARHRWIIGRNATDWMRDTGDQNETETNDVGPGHKSIGDPS